MRLKRSVLFAVPVLALVVARAHDASACGGEFQGEMENNSVSAHRMVFSISKTQTTLWDQIKYTGDPASFAWVLPIKGTADVALSSDALFAELEQLTTVTVDSPPYPCQDPCSFNSSGAAGSGGAGTGGGGPTILADKVVGPFETVQLMSADPNALTDWLTMNGFNIPVDIQPIIDAYVAGGFNFLALKLASGQGIDKIKPVRVTTMGASPTLPLRMVAAGTGNTTAISLWIAGEGRYAPSNAPSFEIQSKDLIWDWKTNTSNYAALKQKGYDASTGLGWLVAGATPFSPLGIESDLTSLAASDPVGSGYADDMGMGAPQAAQDDLTALFSTIDAGSLWLTRLEGELPRAGLANDLVVGASADQSSLDYNLFTTTSVNAPMCPMYPPCDSSTATGSGGSTATGAGGGIATGSGAGGAPSAAPPSVDTSQDTGNCSTGGPPGDAGLLAIAGLGLVARLFRRRR